MEVIIVVAIIAVTSSVLVSGFSIVPSMNVKSGINKISSLLSYTRVSALSGKQNAYLEITKTDDTYYAYVFCDTGQINSENLGNNIAVFFTNTSGDIQEVDESTKLALYYNNIGAFSEEVTVESIIVKSSNESKRINITPTTGHHEIA